MSTKNMTKDESEDNLDIEKGFNLDFYQVDKTIWNKLCNYLGMVSVIVVIVILIVFIVLSRQNN